MRDLKYIIKRVIIGLSIALLIYFIKGNILLNVHAEQINFIPNDIVIVTSDSNNSYSAELNNWANEYVYAFPTTTPTDWQGFANIYFRYSQFNGSSYCSGTANNGSISGRIYNGLRPANVGSVVKLEDRVNNTYSNCDTNIDGAKVSFVCNNVNLSHSLNIVITNSNGGRYGISRALDINCSMTNEGLANAIVSNNNQNTQNIINNNNQNTQKIDDTLKDDNVNGASNQGASFFNNFQSNDHGLSGIISAPLRLIQSISSSTCTPLSFQLPFVHNNVSLPCMSTIYETYFSSFLNIYRIITTGLIGYWVVIRIFAIVKGFQDPNSSKVEVLDL